MGSRKSSAGRRFCAPLFLVLPALVIFLVPGLAGVFEFDRGAIAGGQIWRLLSGHWTHWSFDHFVLDTLVLAAVAAAYQMRGGRRLLTVAVASSLAISGAMWVAMPHIERYRGLSGVDAAVTIALAVLMIQQSRTWSSAVIALAPVGLLAAKIVFEIVTAQTAFVDSFQDGFVPIPLAHAVGALCGLIGAKLPVGLASSGAGSSISWRTRPE